jgi:hypothetical protein
MNNQHHLSQTSIGYRLFWDLRPGKELVVEVENLTRAAICRLYVLWQYDGETPSGPHAQVQSTIAQLQEAGGNTIFEPQTAGQEESALSTDLAAGSRCQFIARGGTVGQILSRVAALTPAQYSIRFQAQGREFARVPGSELATFLAQPACGNSGA